VEVCRTKTLALLQQHRIDPARITLFVANNEEKALYEAGIPQGMYGKIIVAVKGHREVKNWIANYYPLGTEYVSCDDDLYSLVELDGNGGLRPLHSLHELILQGFKECKNLDYHLWGISPVANGFFLKQTIHTDCKFCIGHFFGVINRRIPITLNLKDDYERSLQNTVRDGGVIRFSYVAGVTKYCASGGINQSKQERSEANKKEVEFLMKEYPNLVRLNKKREGEILLQRSLKKYLKVKASEDPVEHSQLHYTQAFKD
jgi:hypothetical protein